jgi:hypothetical protein
VVSDAHLSERRISVGGNCLSVVGLAGFDSICSSRKTLGSNLVKLRQTRAMKKQISVDNILEYLEIICN